MGKMPCDEVAAEWVTHLHSAHNGQIEVGAAVLSAPSVVGRLAVWRVFDWARVTPEGTRSGVGAELLHGGNKVEQGFGVEVGQGRMAKITTRQ